MNSVLFLADKFSDVRRDRRSRYPGGAERTDEIAINACPYRVTTRRVREVTAREVRKHDVTILANAEYAPAALLEVLSEVGNHVLFEHDLRVCRWRGNFPVAWNPAHRFLHRCTCRHARFRRIFETARGVIFLTELQRQRYHGNPYFAPGNERVLGCSLFDPDFVRDAGPARSAAPDRSETIVFASKHRIKGRALARAYCKMRGHAFSEVSNLPYDQLLARLARAKRFVYLPLGMEPAGRMPVEARLLGCEVVVNDNVGVAGERFFHGSSAQAREHLASAPRRFWQMVEAFMSTGAAERHERPTRGLEVDERLEIAREMLTLRRREAACGTWLAEPVSRAAESTHVLPAWEV